MHVCLCVSASVCIRVRVCVCLSVCPLPTRPFPGGLKAKQTKKPRRWASGPGSQRRAAWSCRQHRPATRRPPRTTVTLQGHSWPLRLLKGQSVTRGLCDQEETDTQKEKMKLHSSSKIPTLSTPRAPAAGDAPLQSLAGCTPPSGSGASRQE